MPLIKSTAGERNKAMLQEQDPRVSEIVAAYLAGRGGAQPARIEELVSRYPAADRARLQSSAMIEIARRSGGAPGRGAERGSSGDPAAHRLGDALLAAPTVRMTVPPAGEPAQTAGYSGHEIPCFEDYEVVELVGRGGMGAVYEALQHSTGRRVALKVMRADPTTGEEARRRFEREVELAARLSHPNIVTVLDSGLHRGLYYLVMDFVPGRRLDEAFRPGECAVRPALEMLATICEAVDYAHQRGVLHRDLKPSNILIDERGQPQVLDFGLAKALNPDSKSVMGQSLSRPGQIIGTPQYMSPEQLQGAMDQLTVRSDVYALGVIGYELMAGSSPVDGAVGIADAMLKVTSQDPLPPSRRRRGLSRDVDAILLKALRQAPSERYATAGELAADLRRYLANRPIVARRSGPLGRMWRWTRRHRALATTAALGLIAVAATGGMAAYREYEQKQTSDEVLSLTLKLHPLDYQFDKLPEWADSLGDLKSSLEDFKQEFSNYGGSPARMADNWARLAQLYYVTGQFVEAERMADQAWAGYAQSAAISTDAFSASHLLGRVRHKNSHYKDARRAYEQALAGFTSLGPQAEKKQLAVLADLGWVCKDKGDYESAFAYFKQAIALMDEAQITDAGPRSAVFNNYGMALAAAGRNDEAESSLREALRLRQVNHEDDEEIAASKANLGNFLSRNRGAYSEAEKLLREAFALRKKKYGEDHANTLVSNNQLALLLRERGKYAEALQIFNDVLLARKEALGERHEMVIVSEVNVGLTLNDLDRAAEAEQHFSSAGDLWTDKEDVDRNPLYALTLRGWADCLRLLGRLDEAETNATRALRLMGEARTADAGITHMLLAEILLAQGNAAAAESEATTAVSILTEKLLPATNWKIGRARSVLGATRAAQGKWTDARTDLEAGAQDIAAALGPDNRYAVEARTRLEECLTHVETSAGIATDAAQRP